MKEDQIMGYAMIGNMLIAAAFIAQEVITTGVTIEAVAFGVIGVFSGILFHTNISDLADSKQLRNEKRNANQLAEERDRLQKFIESVVPDTDAVNVAFTSPTTRPDHYRAWDYDHYPPNEETEMVVVSQTNGGAE